MGRNPDFKILFLVSHPLAIRALKLSAKALGVRLMGEELKTLALLKIISEASSQELLYIWLYGYLYHLSIVLFIN